MTSIVRGAALALVLLGAVGAMAAATPDPERLELGQRMYREGILPSGERMRAVIRGDIAVTGEQVICGSCHRRSGFGSSEGNEVTPPVTRAYLYAPVQHGDERLAMPVHLIRPAYTDETLKRVMRAGINAAGQPLGPLMPRYLSLTDAEADLLVDYLKHLSATTSAGVTDRDMHFATLVGEHVDTETRKAFVDVMQTFFQQKNVETRYESKRAEHPPWHKEWQFTPYRKWVLHVWELKGPAQSWPAQLEAHYRDRPVFAVLSGVATGSWRPVHEFCEAHALPCVFPSTDLPEVNEDDFYSVYLSKGVRLEGEVIARHLGDEGLATGRVVQVYRAGDPRGAAAAAGLRGGLSVRDSQIWDRCIEGPAPSAGFWPTVLDEVGDGVLVLWLGEDELPWEELVSAGEGPVRVYLSTTLYDAPVSVPASLRDRTRFVHPYELPDRLPRLLARSTGWFRAKHILGGTPEALRVQANAYFTLKIAGDAVVNIRSLFVPEYFIERIEHMMDNASYTSVYPRVSLAPGQRFVVKGAYIAKVSEQAKGGLVPVTDWLTP